MAASGGDPRRGQVWQYRPGREGRGELTLVFESPGAGVLNGPDNLTVSPRGRGLLICEENWHGMHLRGITPQGAVFDFARNLADMREFAGVCFSPDGETLFVNLQGSLRRSATYAIRGPWRRALAGPASPVRVGPEPRAPLAHQSDPSTRSFVYTEPCSSGTRGRRP
jgi:hypothetical protein